MGDNTRCGTRLSRRQFLRMAAAIGAAPAWAYEQRVQTVIPWRERRDLYPEGVASGDPDAHSVLLWTRRPYADRSEARLRVDVSTEQAFASVIASAAVTVSAAADWTCRTLVGNLEPGRVYWYRFTDDDGNGSRIGRTRTAPAGDDGRPVKFAFVSCQSINDGALHAYRRLIAEDQRAEPGQQLGFVLHLGDFIYEAVWYPDETERGLSGRPLREVVRYPQGETITMGRYGRFHIPRTLDDYRAVYHAYLHDPDLQDARAHLPFVCMWDNHEFSWAGWQSLLLFNAESRPAQTRKVAAHQAWFEFQPARVRKASGAVFDEFRAPDVNDAPIRTFDEHGFGDEPNNRAAVASLTGYRSLAWGRHLELLVTDQRSYRSQDPFGRLEASPFTSADFPNMIPQEAAEILDAGRAYGHGNPPEAISFGSERIPNFRKSDPPQTVLGPEQKRWLLDRLTSSPATWKIWGNSQKLLDGRVDPQNLPDGVTKPWPGAGYAVMSTGDPSTAYMERAEIYGTVRKHKIAGFAIVSGDFHSFWAGLAAPSLPPQHFEPVGVAFVTGSISSPGTFEYLDSTMPQDHPLRALYVTRRTEGAGAEPTLNLLFRHGVRSALEYARTGDLERARRLSNPDLSPHLSFLDLGGHGYATVRATADALECEFVCIPRPIQRNTAPDGGPLLYRVAHRAPLWRAGEAPRLEQRLIEGNPALSL
jgi:alkaline phosphatase D